MKILTSRTNREISSRHTLLAIFYLNPTRNQNIKATLVSSISTYIKNAPSLYDTPPFTIGYLSVATYLLPLISNIEPPNNLKNPQHTPQLHPPPPRSPQIIQNYLSPLSNANASSLSRTSILALSATVLSALIASVALFPNDNPNDNSKRNTNPIHEAIESTFHKSNESFRRIIDHVKHTGVAASILWQSLSSVLSSANHEVRAGFELRVAALLADISAANEERRAAIVGAGGGKVVDWLLETVAVGKDGCGTQAEAARALAYLIADPNVSKDVLGRPRAVPNLLRFIFSCQPRSKKHSRRSSFDISDSLKGRSMLVAAIMDVVTSNCDSLEKVSFKSSLPGNAETRDIAAAIEVIEEGGMHFDEPLKNDDDDDGGGKGIKGIGIKILEGTTVLGLSRTSEFMGLGHSDDVEVESVRNTPKTLALLNKHDSSLAQANLSSAVVPGLWDDLHCQHVAVPFAAWALANWAMASGTNRSRIQELDQDGYAVMSALTAPERSVKWHGSLVARLLLEDRNLPLNDSVSDWSSSLLSTVSQACKNEDIPLALVALSGFLVSIDRSPVAQKVVMEKGLQLMRDTAKCTLKHKEVQEALAKALKLLSTGDMHLSLEETRKSSVKRGTPPKSDKVKTQIDQSNVLFATQTVNQLAGAVVNLAGKQLGTATGTESVETFPLADLLSLEPFAGPLKNLKKDSLPKVDATDSAVATLKGIKALTELCDEDSIRRVSDVPGEASVLDANNPSSVRVPPTAHIRRHAARLLTVLSLRPDVQNAVKADETWCKWLEDCANGKIQGCSDLKMQSYARATLLNIFCNHQVGRDSANGNALGTDIANKSRTCPRYYDKIFLINPELPHWKCPEHKDQDVVQRDKSGSLNSEDTLVTEASNDGNLSSFVNASKNSTKSEVPQLDIVFVHGMRGGPYKTWRISEDKSSTKSGLVEKIDQEAGKQGTFWPGEWLSADFPHARLFTLKYKTNLTQWSGASLPLQEVSTMLLEKLVAAGIGSRPVVFVTHSMGGLVVKQMLHKARAENIDNLVKNTAGIVFYSCPHFGSKLADMPWRMGLVLRPAPTIVELRSGSPRLIELNDYIRQLHKKGMLEVLSFCETKVTPIVEGYGGWAFRIRVDRSYKFVQTTRSDGSFLCKNFRILAQAEIPPYMKMLLDTLVLYFFYDNLTYSIVLELCYDSSGYWEQILLLWSPPVNEPV
ncbi:hypothetical protein Pint_08834 [Pistacia integerrima]|uniref:Uncharacterized protein n=1 Tax=Pistacia integerrima TaxID=434235 RepID=A0ACC0XSS1_9ROSI|nr:hypothetical protein Pint_08834 [Pistacia integerrima]